MSGSSATAAILPSELAATDSPLPSIASSESALARRGLFLHRHGANIAPPADTLSSDDEVCLQPKPCHTTQYLCLLVDLSLSLSLTCHPCVTTLKDEYDAGRITTIDRQPRRSSDQKPPPENNKQRLKKFYKRFPDLKDEVPIHSMAFEIVTQSIDHWRNRSLSLSLSLSLSGCHWCCLPE
jgi:hypothetical protein